MVSLSENMFQQYLLNRVAVVLSQANTLIKIRQFQDGFMVEANLMVKISCMYPRPYAMNNGKFNNV